MSNILIVCEDPRSHAALTREFTAKLHIGRDCIFHAPTASEALYLITSQPDPFAVTVIVAEEESSVENHSLRDLCLMVKAPIVFVNLRPGRIPGSSLQAPADADLYMGPETRVDQVRKAVKRYVVQKQKNGGWR